MGQVVLPVGITNAGQGNPVPNHLGPIGQAGRLPQAPVTTASTILLLGSNRRL